MKHVSTDAANILVADHRAVDTPFTALKNFYGRTTNEGHRLNMTLATQVGGRRRA